MIYRAGKDFIELNDIMTIEYHNVMSLYIVHFRGSPHTLQLTFDDFRDFAEGICLNLHNPWAAGRDIV